MRSPGRWLFFAGATLSLVLAHHLPEVLIHNGLTALTWVPLILVAASVRAGPLCSSFAVFLGRISLCAISLPRPANLRRHSHRQASFRFTVCAASGAGGRGNYVTGDLGCVAFLLVENASRRSVLSWLLRRSRVTPGTEIVERA